MKKKRVLVIADLHCGHLVGLTPPEWQRKFLEEDVAKHNKFVAIQRDCWDFFTNEVNKLKPIDICIVNGDMIAGEKEETELLEPDRNRQCNMALHCLKFINAKHYILTYGTGWHTGDREDFEDIIADKLGAKIGAHEWLDINGVIFDIKHFVSSSVIPHGRATAIKRSVLWNLIWAERNEQPKSNVYIRSHTHYFEYAGNRDYIAIITPALQAMGSKFGSRRCEGTVDFGFIHFDIETKGRYVWQEHIALVKSQTAKVVKL